MKNTLTLLIVIFSITFLKAQTKLSEDNISIGEPYPVLAASNTKYIEYKDKIVAIKYYELLNKARYFSIETFDSKNLTLMESNLLNDHFSTKSNFEDIVVLNNRIYVFYSVWDKKSKIEQLYAQEINPASCSFRGDEKLIFTIQGSVTSTPIIDALSVVSSVYQRFYKYEFHTSFDKSKVLIQYRKEPKKNNDAVNKDMIGLHVFDESLSLTWGKEVIMPYTKKKMDNLDYALDSEGNAILAALVYRDNTTRKLINKQINYDIEIITVQGKSDEIIQNKINIDNDKHIVSLNLFEVVNNKVICTGYYAMGKNANEVKKVVDGAFKFNINQTGENSEINYYDIPLDVINQNIKQKQVDKNNEKEFDKNREVGLAYLVPKNIVTSTDSSDESMFIIGEVQYSITTVTTTSRTIGATNMKKTDTDVHYKYYNNDILITKINADNSLAWMKKLPKTQIASFPKGNKSFKIIEGKNAMYLIFVDRIENLELGSDETPKPYAEGLLTKGHVTAYKLGYSNGDMEKISLFDIKNIKGQEITFILDNMFSISNDEFIVELYKKTDKKNALVRVKLE